MRTSAVAAVLAGFYRVRWGRRLVRGLVLRLEGGEMTSSTWRRILAEFHGVVVGSYTYGSLLRPGMAQGPLHIGRYCSIGPGVRRFSVDHPVDRVSTHPYFCRARYGLVPEDTVGPATDLVIGDEVWIGADVVILPRVTSIGPGAVIGAGTVLTSDVPPFAVVVGNPGRVVTNRLSASAIELLVAEAPWRQEPAVYAHRASRPLMSET